MDRDLKENLLEEIARECSFPTDVSSPGFPAAIVSRIRDLVRFEQKSRQVAETLRVASIEIAKGFDQAEILAVLLDYLSWIVPYDGASVVVENPDGSMTIPSSRDFFTRRAGAGSWNPLQGDAGRALLKAFEDKISSSMPSGDGGVLAVPVSMYDDAKAILVMERVSGGIFGENEIKYAEALASQAAVARDNSKLFQSVASSERYFRALTEKSADIITLLSSDCVIRYLGPSGYEVFGLTEGRSSTGLRFTDFVIPEDRSVFSAAFSPAASVKSRLLLSFRIVDASLKLRYCEGSLADLHEDQAIGGWVLNWRDVTERKEHERIREAIALTAERLRDDKGYEEMLHDVMDCASKIMGAERIRIRLDDKESGIPEIEMELGAASSWLKQLQAQFIVEGKSFGSLAVYREEDFLATDMTLLTAVADIAASAIRRAFLFEQTQNRLERLETLRKIERAISMGRDLSSTLDIVLEQATAGLKVDAADIMLYRPGTETLEIFAQRGYRHVYPQRTVIKMGSGYAGKVGRTREVMRDDDIPGHATGSYAIELYDKEGFVFYFGVPLVVSGQLLGVLEVFNRASVDQGGEWEEFAQSIGAQAAIAIDNVTLFDGLKKANDDLLSSYDRTIEGWSRALELRDHETEGHTARVADLAVRLADILNLPDDRKTHLKRGALLHDIGKIGIPDSILLKPDRLTPEERAVMEKHTVYAFNLLSSVDFLKEAIGIPYCHHEKWDGTGYPRGLKGTEIPLEARVFAIIDVWDAITNDRPYHKAMKNEEALELINQGNGSHFDPDVVKAFNRLF